VLVDRNDRSISQVLLMLGEHSNHHAANSGWHQILRTNLQDARSTAACERKERREVEIIREHDTTVEPGT
jgi:hypothetical protein